VRDPKGEYKKAREQAGGREREWIERERGRGRERERERA
jgi:hypothetical protein